MAIQKTRDWAAFKKLDGNRPINRYHLNKMIRSIQEDNQLHLHPIIVNKDMCVIDGQHRLEVAKELGLDIYFIHDEAVSDMHLVASNANQKIFDTDNYIDFFAVKNKIPEYIELQKMMKETGLRPKALLTLILGMVSKNILEFLKTGKFKFPENFNCREILDFYMDFKAYVTDKKLKPYSMFTNHNFTKAFRWLFLNQNFDKSVFFKKLDLKCFDLRPQSNAENWYKLLANIYNFRNHAKIEEEVLKDK